MSGSYHLCSGQDHTSPRSLCCSTEEPCWPVKFVWSLPPTRPSLQVLMLLRSPEVSPARQKEEIQKGRLPSGGTRKRYGGFSLSGWGLAKWKIKIAPLLLALSFQLSKLIWRWGVQIPPCWASAVTNKPVVAGQLRQKDWQQLDFCHFLLLDPLQMGQIPFPSSTGFCHIC